MTEQAKTEYCILCVRVAEHKCDDEYCEVPLCPFHACQWPPTEGVYLCPTHNNSMGLAIIGNPIIENYITMRPFNLQSYNEKAWLDLLQEHIHILKTEYEHLPRELKEFDKAT